MSLPHHSVSATALAQHLRSLATLMSTVTVRRRLLHFGLQVRRPIQSLPLTLQQRTSRMQWCTKRNEWRNEWPNIVAILWRKWWPHLCPQMTGQEVSGRMYSHQAYRTNTSHFGLGCYGTRKQITSCKSPYHNNECLLHQWHSTIGRSSIPAATPWGHISAGQCHIVCGSDNTYLLQV